MFKVLLQLWFLLENFTEAVHIQNSLK